LARKLTKAVYQRPLSRVEDPPASLKRHSYAQWSSTAGRTNPSAVGTMASTNLLRAPGEGVCETSYLNGYMTY